MRNEFNTYNKFLRFRWQPEKLYHICIMFSRLGKNPVNNFSQEYKNDQHSRLIMPRCCSLCRKEFLLKMRYAMYLSPVDDLERPAHSLLSPRASFLRRNIKYREPYIVKNTANTDIFAISIAIYHNIFLEICLRWH